MVWIDPLVGIVGAGVIVSWAVSLVRSSGAVLLDVSPARRSFRAFANVWKPAATASPTFIYGAWAPATRR